MKKPENCVAQVNGRIEANQIKAFLNAHGIPCEFQGESVGLTHGFTLNGLGVVSLCVPGQMVDQAKELLAQADSGELQLPDQAEVE